jgi:hypothetical protein
MFVLRSLGTGLAIVALAATSIAVGGASAEDLAPTSDDYVHAATLPIDPGFIRLNNTEATTEAGEVTTFTETAYKHIWSTVWAKWTAPASGAIEVDTNASGDVLDTSLAIYSSATSLAKATRLAWNDDAGTNLLEPHWSKIDSLSVVKGTTYYFQAGTASGDAPPATGWIYININPKWDPPANDNEGSAVAESGTAFAIDSASYGSTLESFENVLSAIDGSIWYRWTPASTGKLVIDPAGSAADTYYEVWEQPGSGNLPSGTLVPLGGARDGSPTTIPTLNAGSTYLISAGSTYHDGAIVLHATETVTGPVITEISASSGTVKGGTKITITGARLTDVNEVDFGASSAIGSKIVHTGSTKLTVTTPAAAKASKVYVQLDTSTGLQSVVNTASHFTYK